MEAAKLRKDQALLLEIHEVDLIAKEFKNHEKCYRDYTRIICPNESQSTINDKGDFKAVCSVIDHEVLSLSKEVSMNVLIDVYGIGRDQHQYRQYLQERILKHYDEKIVFLRPEYHGVQVIISKQSLSEKSFSSRVQFSNDFILKTAASIIHNSVKEKIEKAEKLSWSPTVEELEKREPTKGVLDFLRHLLVGGDSLHGIGERKLRVVKSLADDIMYQISNGQCLTLKHFSLGLGIHSATGTKDPIVVLSKLGHSITYEKVSEIEVAQAEVARQFYSNSSLLPIQPSDEFVKVGYVIRLSVDYFDKRLPRFMKMIRVTKVIYRQN